LTPYYYIDISDDHIVTSKFWSLSEKRYNWNEIKDIDYAKGRGESSRFVILMNDDSTYEIERPCAPIVVPEVEFKEVFDFITSQKD